MDQIKNVINNNGLLDDGLILQAFDQVAANGDIVIFKNDGLRANNKITVVITSPIEKFIAIRYDDVTLSVALAKALKEYFEFFAKQA
ncbi:MAG TPA: hypothetical protein VL727_00825 [Puia sp.]|jgi:hypothetical protein|nr:hypothetical protein [Puia sp.]